MKENKKRADGKREDGKRESCQEKKIFRFGVRKIEEKVKRKKVMCILSFLLVE